VTKDRAISVHIQYDYNLIIHSLLPNTFYFTFVLDLGNCIIQENSCLPR